MNQVSLVYLCFFHCCAYLQLSYNNGCVLLVDSVEILASQGSSAVAWDSWAAQKVLSSKLLFCTCCCLSLLLSLQVLVSAKKRCLLSKCFFPSGFPFSLTAVLVLKCQKLTGVQKAIRQIHGRKSIKGY